MNLLKKSNKKWSFMIYNKVTKIWISKIFKIWIMRKIKFKILKEKFRKRKINLLSIELMYKNTKPRYKKTKINHPVKVLKEKKL
jgi:hypothetical protein